MQSKYRVGNNQAQLFTYRVYNSTSDANVFDAKDPYSVEVDFIFLPIAGLAIAYPCNACVWTLPIAICA